MKTLDTYFRLFIAICLFTLVLQNYRQYKYDSIIYMYIEDSAGTTKGKIELKSKDWKQYIEPLDKKLIANEISLYVLYQGDRIVHSKTIGYYDYEN